MSAAVKSKVRRDWIAACLAFAACCNASGAPLDEATVQHMDVELVQIVACQEHVGRHDLEVLVLAYARVRPASATRAMSAAATVLARMKGGRHG